MQFKPVPLPWSRAPSGTSFVQSPAHSMSDSEFCFVNKNIALVPKFRESEVDSYFTTFERVAAKLKWPKDVWALLLQCSLVGKAQEVSATLPIEQTMTLLNLQYSERMNWYEICQKQSIRPEKRRKEDSL